MQRDGVLVIDDDPDFREAVKMLLDDQSVIVFEAPECATGLAVLERERARLRLILLDYWMPGKTPVECARCLRERAGPEVEIVLVTAAANAAERAIELGIKKCLSKPFDAGQLLRLVSRSGGG